MHKTIYLKDYQKPFFSVESVNLHFDIFDAKTRVKSQLKIRRAFDVSKSQALSLNGERLKLVRITLNQKELTPRDYQLTETHLVLENLPDDFELEIETEIEPQNNKACEGLYQSGQILCTQNESEGFRKITYYLDRPDVMSRFTTTITAEKKKYPVLLANGNPIESGDLPNGRHFVTWQDPFPKPCYLFALVAGDLGKVEDWFTTGSRRKIHLLFYVDKGNESKCGYAVQSLKQAMKWDEDTFGLECDLNTYMIVAVDTFNFGAMENKGLNIFNSQYILASPETATDANFEAIQSVIGHEYFHNWTGNRVTCRDWFQITLKEGLTIFRDQEFSSDMTSRAVKRIEDVQAMRDHQFVEDGGPNAHAIRPSSYIQVNNFYTTTVYQKGSEVIRMIHTLIGRENFLRGMKKYFEMHDGKAVTTEDFVHAMEIVSGRDLTQFKNWYAQAGTPVCKVRSDYDAKNQTLKLMVTQHPPAVAKEKTAPFYFPLSVGLVGPDGRDLPLELSGGESVTVKTEKHSVTAILPVHLPEHVFIFKNVRQKPVPSLLRNFSAPVLLEYGYADEELTFLLAHDSDAFNRWNAAQTLMMRHLLRLTQCQALKQPLEAPQALADAFAKLLDSPHLDAAFKAEAFCVPSVATLLEQMNDFNVEAVFEAREWFLKFLSKHLEKKWIGVYETCQTPGPYKADSDSIGKRSLKNKALAFLVALENPNYRALAVKQFQNAANMTDALAAMEILSHYAAPERDKVLAEFYSKWKNNTLVINKWFAVQASSKLKNILEQVKKLEKDPAFDPKNPNKIRVLFGIFAHNLPNFHQPSGEGYRFIAAKILEINQFNPAAAAQLAKAFHKFSRLDPAKKALMEKELDRILAAPGLSPHVYEIVSNIRGKLKAHV